MRVTKFLLSIMAVMLCITGAFAATTDYKLVTPDEDLSLGYAKDQYYKLGELKVTSADGATEAFDTHTQVVVTVYREAAFTNQSVDSSPTLAYDLVISPDMKAITSGDTFNFLPASIDAGQGLEIGTRVMGDFLVVADGFYLDTLTFKASLDKAAAAFVPPVAKQTDYEFGTYNGSPIKWRVLTVDETNSRALLVTEDIVTLMPYKSDGSSNKWSTSDVKPFLNGTDKFLKEFTEEEKARMLKVSITDGDNSDSSGIINTSGSDTVFLLSATDANKSEYFSGDDSRKLASSNSWWLRSPGFGGYSAAIVDDVGYVLDYGINVDFNIGVRPAFWMKL